MMPGKRAIRPLGGLAALGALALGFQLVAGDHDISGAMYVVISTFCLISAVLMITSKNPVYGALWFALVTLCVCGLFLLQSAPFLAAASIIVYAGAIIVTFLFVMMLAQQSGANSYDQASRQPFIASVIAFTLLGMLLITFQTWGEQHARLRPPGRFPPGLLPLRPHPLQPPLPLTPPAARLTRSRSASCAAWGGLSSVTSCSRWKSPGRCSSSPALEPSH